MPAATSEFIRTLTASDLTNVATALTNTNFADIYTYKVPAKQAVFVGNGKINLGVDDRGSYSMNIQTSAPANIPGVARIIISDANRVNSQFIREDLSADILAGTSSKKVGKGGMTGTESQLKYVTQDQYVVLQYKSTAATATLSAANCTVNLPVTVQTLG